MDFGSVACVKKKWISGFRILDFGFRILDYGFRINNGFWIMDFGLNNGFWILSKTAVFWTNLWIVGSTIFSESAEFEHNYVTEAMSQKRCPTYRTYTTCG